MKRMMMSLMSGIDMEMINPIKVVLSSQVETLLATLGVCQGRVLPVMAGVVMFLFHVAFFITYYAVNNKLSSLLIIFR